MRKPLIVVLALVMSCSGNGKQPKTPTPGWGSDKPTTSELAPIEIPVSTLETTRFATLLKKACEDVGSKLKLGPDEKAQPFSLAEIDALKTAETDAFAKIDATKEKFKAITTQAERTDLQRQLKAAEDAAKKATSTVELEKRSRAGGLASACLAIRGAALFTADHVTSLRAFRDNPTRSEVIIADVTKNPVTLSGGSVAGAIPSVGGALGSMLIDGLATFIYNRAKAEAIGYVAKRLEKILCGDAKDFFKHVCVAFDDLDASTSLSSIGAYLGTAARKDLLRLPDVAIVYELNALADPTMHACTSNTTACENLTAARIGYAYFTEVHGGRRALDVARSLHRVTFSDAQLVQGPDAIHVVGLASLTLDAIMQQENWHRLKPSDDLTFFAVAVVFTIDGAKKTHKPTETWKVTHEALNDNLARKIQLLVVRVVDAHERMTAILAWLEKARDKVLSSKDSKGEGDGDDDENGDEDDSGTSVMGLGRKDLAQLTTLSLADSLATARTIRTIFEGCASEEVCEAINKKSDTIAELLHKVARFGELVLADASVGEIAVAFVDFADLLLAKSSNGHVANIRKALPIVTQLAKAESSDEVVEILEAAALPIGSYAAKSERSSVTLNAFAGIAGGGEFLHGEGWSGAVNTFAPVGVHVSKPWWGNIGVLVSVVNLGNLVSTRFDEDTTEVKDGVATTVSDEQTFEVAEVFSPGVFVTKSFGESPFVFGGGIQAVPSAREVTTTTALEDGTTATHAEYRAVVQVLFFIGVDVSIFSF